MGNNIKKCGRHNEDYSTFLNKKKHVVFGCKSCYFEKIKVNGGQNP